MHLDLSPYLMSPRASVEKTPGYLGFRPRSIPPQDGCALRHDHFAPGIRTQDAGFATVGLPGASSGRCVQPQSQFIMLCGSQTDASIGYDKG